MKALIYNGPHHLCIREVSKPKLSSGQVLISTRAIGICGSDMHAYQHISSRRKPPIIMGHEASGQVVGFADDVKNWEIGDRVVICPVISCGQCCFCKADEDNLCKDRVTLGVHTDGAFAEYAAIPASSLLRIPDTLNYTEATIAEPLSVAVHAVKKTMETLPNKVAIMGCGVIGLLSLIILKANGVRHCIAIDIDNSKLARAKKYGASEVISSNDIDAVKQIKEKYGLVESCIDAVGVQETLDQAISIIQKDGTIVLVGMSDNSLSIPSLQIVADEIKIKGSYCYNKKELEKSIQLLSDGTVNGSDIISRTYPLSDAISAFDCSSSNGSLLRVVLANDFALWADNP